MKTLAVITTHPIQYNAPLFRLLDERKVIKPVVFYTWGEQVLKSKYDPGFGKNIEWDVPLLEGYEYFFPENVSAEPGSHHYKGIDNPGLISSLETLKPDAILVYGWNFKSHLAVMRHFHNSVPVFFRGDSTMMKESGIRKLAKRLLLSVVYRNADHFLFAGKRNRDYFRLAGVKDSKLKFMPHAIDNRRFSNSGFEEDALQLRAELDIPGEALVFLYAGKLDQNKNVKLLAEAFLSLDDPGTYLVTAGDGPCKDELVSRIQGHARVRFLPFQNQARMPVIYRTGDVFVLPSLSETWGLVINEAFACKRPVICSDSCGAAADLIIENETGQVFKNNDMDDLVRKLRSVLDKRKTREMGENAFELVSKWNFDEAAIAVETLTIDAASSHTT